MKLIYFDSVLCGHSCLILLFRIDCVFIMLFTKQVFIFPKIHIVYFTKHQRGRFIKSFDISYSDIFEIYIMDTQMLEAISYIRNVSKKKVTIDKIVTYFTKVHQTGIKSQLRQTWKKCKQGALLMKIITLLLHCHQNLPTFPSYSMMFVLRFR